MGQEDGTLRIWLDRSQTRAFSLLLQQGFSFPVQTGCTLEDLLCRHMCLDPAFVIGRITTIFLNFKPVDDIKSAVVRGGSTLALSGAMPGLVGATMRRGGFYAAMRGGISHAESANDPLSSEGEITVKLFNLMMEELGPVFLWRGILLPQAEAKEFFARQENVFWGGLSRAALDDRPLTRESLQRGDWSLQTGDRLRLCVVFEEPIA